MGKVGANLTKYVSLPIAGLVGGMVKAAMELEATEAKYNTVFEGMTEVADAFIKKFQELTPATTAAARSMASGIQDLLVPMGFMRDEAAQMTGEFMHVIGALTNFNSGTHTAEDVVIALQAAITGEYQTLKRLGVQLDVTTVKQKAVEMGLAETTDEVTKQHQAQVLLAEVYKQSGDALAAYNEESLDAKTKMGLMRAEFVNAAAEFGNVLLPVINQLIGYLRQLTAWLGTLTEEQRKTIVVVGLFAAAVGPILWGLSKFIALIQALAPLLKYAKFLLVGVKAAIAFLGWPITLVIAAVAAMIVIWRKWGNDIKRITGNVVQWVKNMVAGIKTAVAGVYNAIVEPFRKAQKAISGIMDKAKSALSNLNPFKRSSPSLVDLVEKGTSKIQDMYSELGAMKIAPIAHQATETTRREEKHIVLDFRGRDDVSKREYLDILREAFRNPIIQREINIAMDRAQKLTLSPRGASI